MAKPRPQNRTLTGALPRDRPTPERAHRIYVALTNHCNRSCPWCSTCSSPAGSTWLSERDFRAVLPSEGRFEVQLEGGEPTLHPKLGDLIAYARSLPGCERVVLVTNAVVLPRERGALLDWLEILGAPSTLKLSINHHLLARDPGLLPLARLLSELLTPPERELVLNVRLRPDAPGADAWVEQAVRDAGLLEHANVFHLQAYGFAAERDWAQPFVVGSNFRLINPDGADLGVDLIERSEAMRVLP